MHSGKGTSSHKMEEVEEKDTNLKYVTAEAVLCGNDLLAFPAELEVLKALCTGVQGHVWV